MNQKSSLFCVILYVLAIPLKDSLIQSFLCWIFTFTKRIHWLTEQGSRMQTQTRLHNHISQKLKKNTQTEGQKWKILIRLLRFIFETHRQQLNERNESTRRSTVTRSTESESNESVNADRRYTSKTFSFTFLWGESNKSKLNQWVKSVRKCTKILFFPLQMHSAKAGIVSDLCFFSFAANTLAMGDCS